VSPEVKQFAHFYVCLFLETLHFFCATAVQNSSTSAQLFGVASGAVPPLGMLGMHPPPPATFADLVKQH